VEGLEEKIPKLLNLVDPKVEDKENYIRWAAETFDPTQNSEYITWILRLLKKGSIRGEEDSQKMKERLEQFHTLKRKPQFPADRRDINRFKTYGDLAETVDEFSGIETKGEIVRKKREKGIELMEEGDDVKLFVVTESEAGAKYFRNTDWCVKDPRYFDDYGAPYYFFTDGNEKPQTLLHLNSNQCMDVRDRRTDLNSDQQELMETEKMTNYVIANDNSDSAFLYYYEKVGGGYNDSIGSEIIGKIDSAIEKANEDLEIFNISPFDSYSDEEVKYYTPDARGNIEVDLTPFEDVVGDRDFLEVIKDTLNKFDIYPDSDYDSDLVSDEMDAIQINIRYESDYRSDGVLEKIESFASELYRAERSFEMDTFKETLYDKLNDAGYISNDFNDFRERFATSKLDFDNFEDRGGGKFESKLIVLEGESWKIKSHTVNLEYIQEPTSRLQLLRRFLSPFLDYGINVYLGENISRLQFVYSISYEKEWTLRDYVLSLKLAKSVDKHFDFYVNQIQEFYDKILVPQYYTNNREYNPNMKLPILKIASRKESEGQMHLNLHERKSFYDFAVARGVI
jgi:hypothetical protein